MKYNIFAYTETGSDFPGFTSLNVDQRTRTHTLIVRMPGDGGTKIAEIELPPEQLAILAHSILKYMDGDA